MNGYDDANHGDLPISKETQVSREASAGFLSRLTFQWITPLMTAGYRHPLKEADIWTIHPLRRVGVYNEHLQEAFQHRLDQKQPNPLIWSLHEVFKRDFWTAGIALFFGQIFQIIAPLTIRFLIQYVSDDGRETSTIQTNGSTAFGVMLSLVLFCVQMFMTFGFCHGIYYGTVTGAGMRASLTSLIFQKSLKLPPSTKSEASNANETELNPVNLLSTDAATIQGLMMLFHMIWTGPTAVIAALIILFINLTYSAFGGLTLMVLGAATVNKISAFFSARRKEISTARDDRASLLEELLHAVRFIKINAREEKFLSQIKAFRRTELSSLRRSVAVSNIFVVLAASLPAFGAMFSFIIFSLTGHPLTAAEVFSSLAIYNCLRMPLQQLPFLVQLLAAGKVSAGRIESYLSLPEPFLDVELDPEMSDAVLARNATFSWKADAEQSRNGHDAVNGSEGAHTADTQPLLSDEVPQNMKHDNHFKLQDLDFAANTGDLIAIVGDVASGKSSFLAALATEMPQVSGTLAFRSNRAYCSQTAWIMTGSVRENILFGRPFKPDFYQRVLEACALKVDIDSLANADLTQVGERGITLSGGQKQRISLARAIYSDCEVVLLDDPLSAVDADVGRHILDNAIRGLLEEKCTIIATHNFDILPYCTNIIWMEDGSIKAQGSLRNMRNDSDLFTHLTRTVKPILETHKPDTTATFESEHAEKSSAKSDRAIIAQIEKEQSNEGRVTWRVYSAYLNATGWPIPWLFVVILRILAVGTGIFTNVWLAWWSSQLLDLSRGIYIAGYIGLTILQYVISYLSDVIATVTGLSTSEALFEKTIEKVMAAPISFFDSIPIGRLLSLFTADIDALDNKVTRSLESFLMTFVLVMITLAMIAVYLPPFAVVFPPVLFLAYLGARFFRASSRELTRYAAQFRGEATAKAHEAITGSSTIRAYGAQARFSHSVDSAIDRMTGTSYLMNANGPWLSIRGDTIGNLLIFLTALLVVLYRGSISPAVAGLVLTYVITIAQPVAFLVQTAAELESSMVSVERITHYAEEVTSEEKPGTQGEIVSSWPRSGAIDFSKISLHYRTDLPAVLHNVSLSIGAGSRVAIVGRTGSGKSSMLSSLMRLSPIDADGGKISIDGLDTAKVPLHRLRTSIKMIPQDPAIFAGTVRSNLDPENQYDDETLLSVLRNVGLTGPDAGVNLTTHTTNNGATDSGSLRSLNLTTPIPAQGSDLSLGQRQLLALCSCLLPPPLNSANASSPPRILLLDEPTSALSFTADEKVHDLIREHWKGRTVVMIAHRLKSLLSAGVDSVVVMDAGRVVEIGNPKELWSNGSSGKFKELCDAAGIEKEDFETWWKY